MVVVYKGARAVNFAHGEIFATAAFVGYLLTANGIDYWGALILAILVTTILGILISNGAPTGRSPTRATSRSSSPPSPSRS